MWLAPDPLSGLRSLVGRAASSSRPRGQGALPALLHRGELEQDGDDVPDSSPRRKREGGSVVKKHDPAGEVCPLCPKGSGVGYCVRHMRGWDPEFVPPTVEEALKTAPDTLKGTLPVHVNYVPYVEFQRLGGIQCGVQVHVRLAVPGGHGPGQVISDKALFVREDCGAIIIRLYGREYAIAWRDLVELWPL